MFALGYTSESYQLLTIDTSDGTVELVGSSVIRPDYLAFTGVPEPNVARMAFAGVLWLIARLRREFG